MKRGLKMPRKIGDVTGKNHQGDAIYDVNGEAPTLSANFGNNSKGLILIGTVSATQKLTSTPQQSTNTTIPDTQTTETAEQLNLMDCQTLTLSLADSLARVSVLLESGEDLKIQEALSFLKSLESLGLNDLAIYSLRMSKDSSRLRQL